MSLKVSYPLTEIEEIIIDLIRKGELIAVGKKEYEGLMKTAKMFQELKKNQKKKKEAKSEA